MEELLLTIKASLAEAYSEEEVRPQQASGCRANQRALELMPNKTSLVGALGSASSQLKATYSVGITLRATSEEQTMPANNLKVAVFSDSSQPSKTKAGVNLE